MTYIVLHVKDKTKTRQTDGFFYKNNTKDIY